MTRTKGLHMTRTKILGLAIGATLLFGYEPIAEATAMAAPPSAVVISNSDGLVVQAVTRAGVAHRSTRLSHSSRVMHPFDSAESAAQSAFGRNFGCGILKGWASDKCAG
jgi:hypothetical protein